MCCCNTFFDTIFSNMRHSWGFNAKLTRFDLFRMSSNTFSALATSLMIKDLTDKIKFIDTQYYICMIICIIMCIINLTNQKRLKQLNTTA